jgi:hypothetical protein
MVMPAPKKSCATCALWQRNEDPPYCGWKEPAMPFWAVLSDGDHGTYTEATDGRNCSTWVSEDTPRRRRPACCQHGHSLEQP